MIMLVQKEDLCFSFWGVTDDFSFAPAIVITRTIPMEIYDKPIRSRKKKGHMRLLFIIHTLLKFYQQCHPKNTPFQLVNISLSLFPSSTGDDSGCTAGR